MLSEQYDCVLQKMLASINFSTVIIIFVTLNGEKSLLIGNGTQSCQLLLLSIHWFSISKTSGTVL